MHFNTKVGFNRLVSDLDREGMRRFRAEPWDIDYGKVVGYAPGEIHLDNDSAILVREGYDEIKAIMDAKEREKESYDEYQRRLSLMGMPAMPDEDDDEDDD